MLNYQRVSSVMFCHMGFLKAISWVHIVHHRSPELNSGAFPTVLPSDWATFSACTGQRLRCRRSTVPITDH